MRSEWQRVWYSGCRLRSYVHYFCDGRSFEKVNVLRSGCESLICRSIAHLSLSCSCHNCLSSFFCCLLLFVSSSFSCFLFHESVIFRVSNSKHYFFQVPFLSSLSNIQPHSRKWLQICLSEILFPVKASPVIRAQQSKNLFQKKREAPTEIKAQVKKVRYFDSVLFVTERECEWSINEMTMKGH